MTIKLPLVLAALLITSAASAEKPKRPPRPVVCASWKVFESQDHDHDKVAVCTDKTRPVVLTSFAEVVVGDSRWLVGVR